uniref:TOG domain-containing protein n=1 Tax=Graphocephala atropunctata TaxID=36148 RepID=A0A1B6M0W7_9HEMI
MLKDQMIVAGVNKALIANMFHADFKYHLRAIDSLSEDLATNADAQRANLDLILRWMTLRFFDTNPSVLLKGLEYLQTLFTILTDNNYNMLETEAASFLPYLILKLGDPKDTVRNSVKALLKQIANIYSASKIFVYTMDGIKSKNARQRTECLDHLAFLMDKEGMSVCQPTPATSLKEIAKQISDRDNSVRNAAINCIVIAYFLDGEKVLKMLGQISDKDMSLLEERIKRAAKNRPVASVKPLPQTPLQRPPPPAPAPVPTPLPVYDEPEPDDEEMPPLPPIQSPVVKEMVADTSSGSIESVRGLPMHELEYNYEEDTNITHELVYNRQEKEVYVDDNESDYQPRDDVPQEQPRPIVGPYGLDQALLDNIETRPVNCPQPKLIEFDLHFLREPSTHLNPAPKLDTSLSPLSKMSNCMTLEWHLTQIGNRDFDRALSATQHIETLLASDQRNQLHQHEDLLVAQLVRQLEFLNQSNHPDVVNGYKKNLGLFVKFFGNYPELSRNVKEDTLREAIKTLIILLTEKRLEMLDPGTDMFVRVVNNVVIRILDKSDHTAIICALVKNLYDTVSNTSLQGHYQELLMKCIWKVIKFLDDWHDMQFDRIFVEIHAFLRDYPSSWWKKQTSDTPLRTVKTIMHTIVKLNGPVIGEIVRNVRGVTPESELWTYVQKLLKHIQVSEDKWKESIPDNREIQSKSKRMSKSTHDQLSEIFRKIGSRDETNEGLRLLYEFKQQCPDADINPFLQKSSKFFQDYIERGLKGIEADIRMEGKPIPDNKLEVEDSDSTQYLHRLRAWQAKAGWNNIPAAATRPTPLSPPHQPDEPEPLPTRHPQLDISGDNLMTDETEVEALRKRLEKVRSTLR